MSLSNHSLPVFFIIAVFLKDTISLTTSINFWKKIVVCLVYIMISLIIWEYNFAQSLFVLIYLIVFKRSNWNLVAVTYFLFFYFSLAKIFIDFLRPKVLQNSRYFFVSDDTLLCSFCLLLMLNHSDVSLYSDPLVYVILRLTYWASLNCLIVFLETLFDLEVYK